MFGPDWLAALACASRSFCRKSLIGLRRGRFGIGRLLSVRARTASHVLATTPAASTTNTAAVPATSAL